MKATFSSMHADYCHLRLFLIDNMGQKQGLVCRQRGKTFKIISPKSLMRLRHEIPQRVL